MKSAYRAAVLAAAIIAAVLAFTGCGGQKSQAHLPVKDLFQQAKSHYDKHKYLSAIEEFQAVVYNYPGEMIIDTAQYYLALSYFGNKEYSLASTEFNRYLLNYPTSAYAVASQFMKAVSAYEETPTQPGLDQSALDDAIRQLEDFITDHPESEFAADARKYLGLAKERLAEKYYNSGITYSRMGAADAAKVYFQKVIDDYTDSPLAPLASFNIAKEEMNLNHFDEARVKFETFKTVFPKHALANEAVELAREAALKAARALYDKGDMKGAGPKFETVVKDFPNTDEARKAEQFLRKIREQLPDTTLSTNAKS